jgi:hypothetical protein
MSLRDWGETSPNVDRKRPVLLTKHFKRMSGVLAFGLDRRYESEEVRRWRVADANT